jgi:branched-chain amino acid aminotransferase
MVLRLWHNGKVLPEATAPTISPTDHGITVGDGVFETLKVTDGVPFALTRHLERLARSATGLGLPKPDLDFARRGVAEVLSGWEQPAGRLRITYTGGPAPLGSERGDAEPTLLVAVTDLAVHQPATAVTVVPWTRNENSALTGLKTTSYAENVVALAYAAERGTTEALFANTAGRLCEGTGSNVFVVTGGRLLTPPLSSGCLAGVTRALVLEWCGAEEADLPMSVLDEADEIFLTSTTRDVQGVSTVRNGEEERKIDAPGPRTTEAMETFALRAAADLDP